MNSHEPADRVVIVHGPVDDVLRHALRSSGFQQVAEDQHTTVWAPPRPTTALSDPPGPATLPALLTVAQAAQQLGIGRSTLYPLLVSGQVDSVKIGGCRRVPAAAIDAYVRRLTRA